MDDYNNKYRKLTLYDQIKKNPDMYIGSMDLSKQDKYIYDEESKTIEQKSFDCVDGFFKIIDEVITNAKDHSVEDKTCNKISVTINPDNSITFFNNGDNGVPVVIHDKYKEYVPEIIFSNLITSSNYHTTNKIVGGKNGFGVKLANMFSTSFELDIVDSERKLRYQQLNLNGMKDIQKPRISKSKKRKAGITIKLMPDYKTFGITMNPHIFGVIKRRVYDIAACTRPELDVYFNDEKISANDFNSYIKLYYKDEKYLSNNLVYKKFNDRWEVGVVFDSSKGYNQVSFVNGIFTDNGGTHVNYIANQVIKKITDKIKTSPATRSLSIKSSTIKNRLSFYVNATIEDPTFQSQVKSQLTTSVKKFGSKCVISDDFINLLMKTDLLKEVIDEARYNEVKALKKTDGSKTSSVLNVDKLTDAKHAGTRNAHKCTMILVEGDSAKNFAQCGISSFNNKEKEYFGIFPLKGKLINVRNASVKKLKQNKEIENLKKILGIKEGKDVSNVKELRYGKVLIMTDEDVDGYHIKGLIMNFFEYYCPSLIKDNNFLCSMTTPIVKVWKKTDKKKLKMKKFYTLTGFRQWKDKTDFSKWDYKYYKGLGTSTNKEAKECFSEYNERRTFYVWGDKHEETNLSEISDTETSPTKSKKSKKTPKLSTTQQLERDETFSSYQKLLLAFDKTQANKRKKWMSNYDKDLIIENSERSVPIYDFINKTLIHFSVYDLSRSVPSVVDGLKPSQRKILYSAFLKKIKGDIKVSQFAGYVSERSGYHHGEASLYSTIIKMAQQYVGSNNINLFKPEGQFGSRHMGGHDSAAPRYIFTKLNHLTKLIFREEDFCVYEYAEDDGKPVEPYLYAPVIPMVLVNGTVGIGTGYSSDVSMFNPKDIFRAVRSKLSDDKMKKLRPWYRGFKGTIQKLKHKTKRQFLVSGLYEDMGDGKIRITELPIGTQTEKYISYLKSLTIKDKKKDVDSEIITKYFNYSGDNTINIEIEIEPSVYRYLMKHPDRINTVFKLDSKISISNMHLFNKDKQIRKYNKVSEIINAHFDYRLTIYEKRIAYFIDKLQYEANIFYYKVKFLELIISGKIKMTKKIKKVNVSEDIEVIIEKLVDNKFPKLSSSYRQGEESYSYLTNIKMFDMTTKALDKLKKQVKEKQFELDEYKKTTPRGLWLSELNILEEAYDKWMDDLELENSSGKKKSKKTKTKKTKK